MKTVKAAVWYEGCKEWIKKDYQIETYEVDEQDQLDDSEEDGEKPDLPAPLTEAEKTALVEGMITSDPDFKGKPELTWSYSIVKSVVAQAEKEQE